MWFRGRFTPIPLMSEVYAFAERSGVPLAEVNEFFLMLFAHPALKMYTTKLRTRDFDGPMGFAMTGGLKDVTLMGEAHASVGVPFEIGTLIRKKMAECVNGGMGDRDWSAIYELTRRNAGLA